MPKLWEVPEWSMCWSRALFDCASRWAYIWRILIEDGYPWTTPHRDNGCGGLYMLMTSISRADVAVLLYDFASSSTIVSNYRVFEVSLTDLSTT